MTRLHEEKCECGGDKIAGPLVADDTSLVASDVDGLKKSLDVLVERCEGCIGRVV
jgi:hypothetical protein